MQHIINQLRARIRAELRSVFPTQFNLTRKELSALSGVSEGHISNCESIYKKPLVTPVYEGRKPLYPIPDVIDYLVSQRVKTMKKRGAGTKASRISKMAAKESE